MNFLLIAYMAVMSRLSGSGFGAKWGVSWAPEVAFSLPFGIAFGWTLNAFGVGFAWSVLGMLLGSAWSYIFMQSATWPALRWEYDPNPNVTRTATLKPAADWIASKFGKQLGDEAYSWIYMGLKGFLIGLPVGGIPLAILWPLGYEIGSHARGRTEDWIDPHTVSELSAGAFAGVAIIVFIEFVNLIVGWV